MKPKSTLRSFLLLASSSLLAIPSAQAQLTWDANGAATGQTNGAGAWLGTGLWWDGTNNTDWVSGSAAIFGGTATAAGAVTLLTGPTTVESFTFNPAFTGTYTLGTAGQAITLNGGITKNASSAAVTFVSPITLGGAQAWTNNSTTTLLSTGGVDNSDNTLTFDGTGPISFTGTANFITGTGGITKNGTGTLVLGAGGTAPAHDYSGPSVINGGNVMSNNNLSANSDYTLTDATFSDYYRQTTTFTGLGTGDKAIQIYGASGFGGGNGNSNWRIGAQNSVLTWGILNENSNINATGFFNPTTLKLRTPADNNGPSIFGQVTLQNRLDLNSGARTVDVLVGSGNVGASWGKIDAGIEDTGAAGSLTKTGGGSLILGSTTSTWGGTTTISGGLLMFDGNNENNIGGGSARNISVAGGAGVRFDALSNDILNRIVETTDEIGVMTGTTGNSFDFSSATGATLPNAFLGNWAGNGAKATISGTITPGSNGYKFGATGGSGLLGITGALTGANSLTVGMTGSSGIRVNIVAANTHTGDTVINTGSRLTLGNNLALQNSALNVGAAGGNFSLAAGTNGGKITGETEAASPTFGGLKGSRNLISVFSNAASNNETNLAAPAITGFTLNVGMGNTHTYSGSIGGFGTGAVSNTGGDSTLTKTGPGIQFLEGVNTYTGATTISGGNLALGTTGSIASSSSLTIGAGGTLDTSGQSSYAISGSQPVTFGIDPAGSGSSGKIMADGLDISSAAVTISPVATLDDPVYVLATYLSLTGTAFASVTGKPGNYDLVYNYNSENKIALVSNGAPTGFGAWQSANATTGTLADDHDGDGVDNGTEFFIYGPVANSGFTALPGVDNTGGTLSVTWTMAATYGGTYGTDFVVETSATLEAGSWTTEIVAPNPGATVTITGDDVKYTFPAGTMNFARLRVTGPN